MTAASLLEQRPVIRSEIELGRRGYRGATPVYLVVDHRTGRCLEFGAREQFLVARMDGEQTLSEIGEAYLTAFGRPLPERSWVQLLGLLFARDLLVPAPQAPQPPPAKRITMPARQSDVRVGRLVLAHTSSFVAAVHQRTRFLFAPLIQVPLLLAILVMEVVLAAHGRELWHDLPSMWDRPLVAAAVIAFLWLSLSLHEVAHGVTARHFGGDAPEIGVLFRPPLVFLYCRVDAAVLTVRRRHRVATAAAGGWTNLVVLLPLFCWWLSVAQDSGTHSALSAVLLIGSLSGLVNYLPLPPLDGYAMLGDGLGIIDLARGSNSCVADTARRLTGRGNDVAYPPRLRAIYLGYAALRAVLYSAIVAGAVYYCLTVLSPLWGRLTLAALIMFLVAGAAGRLTRTQSSSQRSAQGEIA